VFQFFTRNFRLSAGSRSLIVLFFSWYTPPRLCLVHRYFSPHGTPSVAAMNQSSRDSESNNFPRESAPQVGPSLSSSLSPFRPFPSSLSFAAWTRLLESTSRTNLLISLTSLFHFGLPCDYGQRLHWLFMSICGLTRRISYSEAPGLHFMGDI